jgi:hypothetical protein
LPKGGQSRGEAVGQSTGEGTQGKEDEVRYP